MEKIAMSGNLSTTDRAVLCLHLLDQARFIEAFALYGIELDSRVCEILLRRRVIGGSRKLTEEWSATLRQALWASAPWLIPETLKQEGERLRQWTSEKRSRPKKVPHLRLLAFPHQPQQAKVSLYLTADDCDGNGARFCIDDLASNDRLAEVRWKRPIEMDLLRLGLE